MHTTKRLLEYFIPTKYTLTLDLSNAKKRDFNGKVLIHGEAQSNTIYLHAKDIDIDKITLNQSSVSWHHVEDEISIEIPTIENEIDIDISFSGKITEAMHGLYPCFYNHEGVDYEIYATQFESHHAREVFPCIDEPAAKAIFDLTLITEKGISVLGNTPIKKQTEYNHILETVFTSTPKMSSYLLAFVAGNMHGISMKSKSGVETTIHASLAQPTESMEFALQMAINVIDFYADYFGVEYPLAKIDHVALPDFSSGAMENWGLITYRESALIVDKYVSLDTKTHVAMVIAHELAHQWFGNLVTMAWWDDLWLNESFANFMEYIAIDTLMPEWNVWLKFTDEVIAALRRDCFDNVQPVRVEVSSPDEIGALFDGAIVYAKGARLLRMLVTYIGEDAFKKSLKEYFDKHAYSNTKDSDLWHAMAKASGKDVEAFMHKWLNTPGYPVVDVVKNENKLVLSQQRFFIGNHADSEQTWPILLDTDTAAMPTILDDKYTTLADCGSLVIFNKQNASHYITNYDEKSRLSLIEAVKTNTLSDSQKIQFLNEQTMLARGSKLPSVKLFDILPAYSHEVPHPVWNVIALTAADLKRFVENADDNIQQKLKSYLLKISEVQYERLGNAAKDSEEANDSQLRPTILSFRLYGEDQEFINYAMQSYAAQGISNLSPETLEIILTANVKHNKSNDIVKELLAAHDETGSSGLRYDLMHALTTSPDPATHKLLLDRLKDTSKVKSQDVVIWIVNLLANPKSRSTTWKWINDNWNWIYYTFSGDKSIDDYPRYSSRYLSTETELAEYKKLFEPMLQDSALNRAITIGINEIQARVDLMRRDGPAVIGYLLNL